MALYLVSVGYDESKKSIYTKLYDDVNHNYIINYDKTFKSYCLSNTDEHFRKIKATNISKIEKTDTLNDKEVELFKADFSTPIELAATKKYAETLMENNIDNPFWENNIKIEMSYIYDNQLEMGMPYNIVNGQLIRAVDNNTESTINKLLEMFDDKGVAREIIKLLEYNTPHFKRAAIDIEVKNEDKKMPLPTIANFPVLCVCIYTSEGKRICLLLLQPNKKLEKFPDVDELYIFSSEAELLIKTFELLKQYPMILTFNGDEFDFKYLKNRAHRLKVPNNKISLYPATKNKKFNKTILLEDSMHIDLYRFFSITAIKNYAFGGRYKTVSLDEVSMILLGKRKLNQEHQVIGEMSYLDLVNYCMQDTMLTYELTTFDNNLVINLIMLISRISRIPIEECSRKAVGRWIESFLYNAHRRMGYLIPRTSDILKEKGKTSSKSKVKGKQYEGALVVKPKASIPFDIIGLDFGSLYPSVKKNYNIGYSTICCSHPECRSNTFAELPHWVCKKNRALESVFIGCLRDLRLRWYKKQSKNKKLSIAEINTYKAVEQVIKVIINGDYGVSASETFAFFCPIASEETAGISRSVTMRTIEYAKSLGIEVHYGDTDSIFITRVSPEKVKMLQGWATSNFGIDLELDKEYRFMGFSTRKKNYFGVKPDGTIDIKGLTGKKKHTPQFYKSYYVRILEGIKKIQTEEDIPLVKKEIAKIVKEGYNKLKKREWDNLSELAFHITSSKMPNEYKKTIPQHVKAIKQLMNAGYDYELGTEVAIIKTRKGRNKDSVMPLQLAKSSDVDVEAYTKLFESMVAQIIDIFNLEWDSILGTTKLTAYL